MPSANTKRRDDIIALLKRLASLINDSDKPTLRAVVRKFSDTTDIQSDTIGGEAAGAAVAILQNEYD